MRLAGEQIRLLLICYGFSASLAVYYGLIWRQSLLVTFLWFHLVVCFGIPLAHALWEGGLRKGWRALWRGDDLKRPEAVFVGLASGVPLFAAALAGIWLMMYSGADLSAVRFLLDSWGLAPEWVVLFGLYLGVVNSFLEELLWRGFVLDRLVAWGRRQAILINSFFYSLYHLLVATALFGQQWGWLITGLVFLAGVLWSLLKLRYDTLYASWLSHLLADFGLAVALISWVY